MTRVAIPSISFCQTQILRDEVLAQYPDTRFNEEQRRMSDDDLVEFLSGRDAAIMGLENLTAEMLDRLPDLKIIARMGVGLDNVDPALLRDRGHTVKSFVEQEGISWTFHSGLCLAWLRVCRQGSRPSVTAVELHRSRLRSSGFSRILQGIRCRSGVDGRPGRTVRGSVAAYSAERQHARPVYGRRDGPDARRCRVDQYLPRRHHRRDRAEGTPARWQTGGRLYRCLRGRAAGR